MPLISLQVLWSLLSAKPVPLAFGSNSKSFQEICIGPENLCLCTPSLWALDTVSIDRDFHVVVHTCLPADLLPMNYFKVLWKVAVFTFSEDILQSMEFCPLSPSFQAKIKSTFSSPFWLAADSTNPVVLWLQSFVRRRQVPEKARPGPGPAFVVSSLKLCQQQEHRLSLSFSLVTAFVCSPKFGPNWNCPCCPTHTVLPGLLAVLEVLLALYNQPLTWAQNSGLPPCGQSSVMEPAGFRDFTACGITGAA